MTRSVRVGIVGGCLAAPMEKATRDDLYHQVAARRLARTGIGLRVSLRAIDDRSLATTCESLAFLACRRGCDVLAVQIRPTLLRLTVQAVWRDRGWRGSLCPSPFYRRRLDDFVPPPSRVPLVRCPGLNRLLAEITGLRRRLTAQLLEHVETIARVAFHDLGRPLVIIGPVQNATLPPPLGWWWESRLGALSRELGAAYVALADLDLRSRPECFAADRFHVSPAGHAIIGERFAAALSAALAAPGAAVPSAPARHG